MSGAQYATANFRTIAAGTPYWVGRENVADLVEALRELGQRADHNGHRETFGLTRRERQIVTAILEGCANKDMAKGLCLSEQTIKHHLTKIFAKLGVTNRLELAFFAASHNLGTDGRAGGNTFVARQRGARKIAWHVCASIAAPKGHCEIPPTRYAISLRRR